MYDIIDIIICMKTLYIHTYMCALRSWNLIVLVLIVSCGRLMRAVVSWGHSQIVQVVDVSISADQI